MVGVCLCVCGCPLCCAIFQEGESEKAETRQKVEEDRKPQIEAAIVRIMKVSEIVVAAQSRQSSYVVGDLWLLTG